MKLWVLQGFTLLLSTSTFAQNPTTTTTVTATTTPATTTAVTSITNPATTTAGTTTTNPATSTAVTATTTPATTTAETATTIPATTAAETATTNPATTAAVTDAPTPTDSTTIVPDVHCAGKEDFDPCDNPEISGCKENSKCSCKNQKPFCRCNNDNEKWYIGENCGQEWTVTTFALVASLPGVALAAIVGVAVHLVHHFRKKGPAASVKSSKTQKVDPRPKQSSPMDDHSNIVFASDLQNGQKPQPARSPHDGIPMESHPYGAYRNPSYKNPYASSQPSRNPYSSPDRYDGYKDPIGPTGLQNGIARGNQSGYQQAGPPTSMYSSPDYDSARPQFPRFQTGRQY